MRLHSIAPRPGAKHRKKRLGCGESSGHGKTSGKGHKGQKARAGAAIRIGFEGGQMPLYRRLPRRGFNNARFRDVVAGINVSTLEAHFDAGVEINETVLRDAGLVSNRQEKVKILGNGELTKAFKVTAHGVSAGAREKIEKAGGSVTIVE
jgi:large subunit ribosomal protein L15